MIETLVLLVGRNKLFREGLKSLLNGSQFSVIGEGDDVAHIANLTNGDRPDVVIVDMSDKPEHATDDIGLLRERMPEARIVVLAESLEPQILSSCLGAGANGFLIKDISVEALLQSLRLVMLGETVFPTNLADLLVNGISRVEPLRKMPVDSYGLSQREGQIIRCLAEGDSNKQIANRLQITEATVKVHMKSLMRKIRAANRTQAAIWALHNGLGPGVPQTSPAE